VKRVIQAELLNYLLGLFKNSVLQKGWAQGRTAEKNLLPYSSLKKESPQTHKFLRQIMKL